MFSRFAYIVNKKAKPRVKKQNTPAVRFHLNDYKFCSLDVKDKSIILKSK